MSDTPKNPHPSKLPNGKSNPEYGKWRYHNIPGVKERDAAAHKTWRKSAAGKASTVKYQRSAKAKAAQARYVAKQPRTPNPTANTVTCTECGIFYSEVAAIERGYEIVRSYECICDLCDEPNTDNYA